MSQAIVTKYSTARRGARIRATSGAWGFADLGTSGRAEEKREPIVRAGIACGERTFYRLKSKA